MMKESLFKSGLEGPQNSTLSPCAHTHTDTCKHLLTHIHPATDLCYLHRPVHLLQFIFADRFP